jgi:hypothetical protein
VLGLVLNSIGVGDGIGYAFDINGSLWSCAGKCSSVRDWVCVVLGAEASEAIRGFGLVRLLKAVREHVVPSKGTLTRRVEAGRQLHCHISLVWKQQ